MSWTGILFGGIPRALNPDGTTNIYCRMCGRIVARAHQPRIRTVSKCGVCLCLERGEDPQHALPQYAMTDPTKPPVPLEESGDPMWFYEPESDDIETREANKLFGTARQFFRALFWITEAPPAPPESRKVAKRKHNKGLFADE